MSNFMRLDVGKTTNTTNIQNVLNKEKMHLPSFAIIRHTLTSISTDLLTDQLQNKFNDCINENVCACEKFNHLRNAGVLVKID